MTPEQQRIAIAVACGAVKIATHTANPMAWWKKGCWQMLAKLGCAPCFAEEVPDTIYASIPDYLNDLNATAGAKRHLLATCELQENFRIELLNVFARKPSGFRDSAQVIALKSAEDECEALIRTIGKWKD